MRIGLPLLSLFFICATLSAQVISSEAFSINRDLTDLVHKSHAERTSILLPFYEWGLRYLDKKELIHTIAQTDSLAKANFDRDLELEALVMKAHYLLYQLHSKEEIIDHLKELVNIAQKEKVVWLEIRASSMLGNYYFHDLYEYELGFEYFQHAADLLDKGTEEEYPLKSASIYQLGLAHYYFHDYAEAKMFFKLSLASYRERLNNFYYIHTLNTLGLSYRHLKKYDSANFYFEKLIQYSQEKENKIWEVISTVNLGYSYFLNKESSTAVEILENALENVWDLEDNDLTGEILTKLAEVKFSRKENEEGKNLAIRANEFIKHSLNLEYKAKLYPLLAKAASMNLNPELTSAYIDSVSIAKDSLASLFSGLKIMRAKQKTLLQKAKDETELLQSTQQKALWFRNGGISLLLCLLIIASMKYRKYRVNVSNENIRKTAEADVARRKINALKNLITDINLDKSSHEPNVTNNFSTQTLEDERQDEIIKKLLEAPLLTDRHWNDFVMLFNQIHPDFFDRIDEKWNGLTASEIRLLALTRLDIDNKKMALMLGVGPNAIRQVKSRLRKKIDLGSEKNFEEVIINI